VLALSETGEAASGGGRGGGVGELDHLGGGGGSLRNMGQMGRRLTRARQKTQAYNVCWTSDDARIITLQNTASGDSRLKVWDSFTGDLLRMLPSIGSAPCKQLKPHPLDATLALTGGEDGRVCMWDIEREVSLFSHDLNMSNAATAEAVAAGIAAGPCEIYDLDFSTDGHYAVACDSLGRVSVFGLDSAPKHIAAAQYPQQFFSTDYSEFTVSDDGVALDIGTELPVHASPQGALCRQQDLTAYLHQPQPLYGPVALPANEVESMFLARVGPAALAAVSKATAIAYATFCRNKKTCRQPKVYKSAKVQREEELAAAAARAAVIGSSNITPGGGRARAPAASRRIPSNNVIYHNDADQPSEVESSDSDDDDYDGRERLDLTGNDTLTALWSRGSTRRRQQARSSQSSRIIQDSDESDDDEEEEAEERGRCTGGRSRGRKRKASRAGRAARGRNTAAVAQTTRANPRRDRSNRRSYNESSSDQGGLESSSEESAIEELYDSDVEKQALQARRQQQQEKKLLSRGQSSSFAARVPRAPRQPRRAANWSREAIPLGVDVSRQWLLTPNTSDSQYVPQVGDRVLYFPQGHIEALQLFAEDTAPPWLSFPIKWPLVLCLVTAVRYSFPTQAEHFRCPSVLATVSLDVVGTPHKNRINVTGSYSVEFLQPRQSRHSSSSSGAGGQLLSFSVTLRNSLTPDFLVLESRFLRSIRLPWHEGIRITSAFQDLDENGALITKPFGGRVHALKNKCPQWPHSPWEALAVHFDPPEPEAAAAAAAAATQSGDDLVRTGTRAATLQNEANCDFISPWEADHAASASASSSSSSTTSSSSSSRDTANAMPAVSKELCVRLESAVASLMRKRKQRKRFAPFAKDVDAQAFPDYYCIVAAPFTVSLLRARLKSGFYRQLAAIEADIQLIHSNCMRYNAEGAPISKAAQDLSEALVALLYADPETLGGDAAVAEEDEEEEEEEPHIDAEEASIEEEEKEDKDEEEGVEDEVEVEPATRKRTRESISQSQSQSQSQRDSQPSSQRSGRGRSQSRKVQSSDSEDEDEDEQDDEDDFSNDSSDNKTKPSRGRSKQPRRASARAQASAPARSSRGGPSSSSSSSSYVPAVSSSSARAAAALRPARRGRPKKYREVNSDEEEAEEEEEAPAARKRSRRGGAGGGGGDAEDTCSELQAGLLEQFDRDLNDETMLVQRGPQRVDISSKKELVALLAAARSADAEYGMFAYPVDDEVAPCYSAIITHPMDLSTIESRLERRLYSSVAEMQTDLRCMYSNACFYNDSNSIFATEAARQRDEVLVTASAVTYL